MQPTIQIKCPPEIFDCDDAFVNRIKRVPIGVLDELATLRDTQAIRQKIARLIPQWHNVHDVETQELLTNPQDNPDVLARIDFEQMTWLRSCLTFSPRSPNVLGPTPT